MCLLISPRLQLREPHDLFYCQIGDKLMILTLSAVFAYEELLDHVVDVASAFGGKNIVSAVDNKEPFGI